MEEKLSDLLSWVFLAVGIICYFLFKKPRADTADDAAGKERRVRDRRSGGERRAAKEERRPDEKE